MFAERLKYIRKKNKLTQCELAIRINVTKATISNYENKYSEPSLQLLVLLCDEMNVTSDFLLGRTDTE